MKYFNHFELRKKIFKKQLLNEKLCETIKKIPLYF